MHIDRVRGYVRVHASASIVGSVRFHMLCMDVANSNAERYVELEIRTEGTEIEALGCEVNLHFTRHVDTGHMLQPSS